MPQRLRGAYASNLNAQLKKISAHVETGSAKLQRPNPPLQNYTATSPRKLCAFAFGFGLAALFACGGFAGGAGLSPLPRRPRRPADLQIPQLSHQANMNSKRCDAKSTQTREATESDPKQLGPRHKRARSCTSIKACQSTLTHFCIKRAHFQVPAWTVLLSGRI